MNLNLLVALVFAAPFAAATLLLHYAFYMRWLPSCILGGCFGLIVMFMFFWWLLAVMSVD